MEESSFDAAQAASRAVVDAAIRVHTRLGPGLLESAYEACLSYELRRRGHSMQRQVEVPLVYDDVHLDVGFRLDILVDKSLVVEVKAVQALADIHVAQVITYLKLTRRPLGLLLNFNVHRMKDGGIRRITLR